MNEYKIGFILGLISMFMLSIALFSLHKSGYLYWWNGIIIGTVINLCFDALGQSIITKIKGK